MIISCSLDAGIVIPQGTFNQRLQLLVQYSLFLGNSSPAPWMPYAQLLYSYSYSTLATKTEHQYSNSPLTRTGPKPQEK